jgi:hypothetical protein
VIAVIHFLERVVHVFALVCGRWCSGREATFVERLVLEPLLSVLSHVTVRGHDEEWCDCPPREDVFADVNVKLP